MRRRVVATVLVLLALAFVALPVTIAAANPQPNVTVVKQFTFETGDPNVPDTYVLVGSSADVNAWWGIVARAHSGTKGLWCAGHGGTLPNYAGSKTAGMADFPIPDTSSYYESDFSYWYIYPGATSYSVNPFYSLGWVATADGPPNVAVWTTIGAPHSLTPTWVQKTFNRTGGAAQLPSGSGWAKFTFNDWAGTGSAQGPTIDDVQVTGYLYGPVRSLTAARSGTASTTVDLSWDAPLRFANDSSTVDTRTINYRIWRKDLSTGAYAELAAVQTSDGHVTTSDTSTPIGTAVQYYVQGYNGSSLTDWGELRWSETIPQAGAHFVTPSTSPTTVGYNGQSTVSAQLIDYTGPITGHASSIQVQRSYNGGATWAFAGAATEGAPGAYSATVHSAVNTSYRLFDTATTAGSVASLVRANAYLTTPGTPSSVTHGKYFTVTGKVSRIPVASRTISLRAYQKVGRSWVLRIKSAVKVAAGSGYASYKLKTKLTRRGTYRICAVISDAYNIPATSAYRNFKVK